MEEFKNVSQDMGCGPYSNQAECIKYVVTCIIICIGLPLILVAIYALYSLVGKDHVAPIYVINLLISDLIQFCWMIDWVAKPDQKIDKIGFLFYGSSLVARVYFMVCISLERYLLIACPLWYRFRRPIKISVVVCVLVWIISLALGFTVVFLYIPEHSETILASFFFLPLPLLILFLGGTLKALSASISVPADMKQRIVGMLVVVLLIYTLLFLPIIITLLKKHDDRALNSLSFLFLKLSPLADLVLYVFMRKGAIDKLLASVCCCRMDSNDESCSTV
ncbi:G-protein coupled receptor 4-like [Perca fluviatilis]|uniref:G-protein coupled receptor 4-like n=1 Tax=Perca fluviatilis TaxID=8168 RepID=UPI0019663D01|nr:G-protein coupled receptor 4-like [Perca fluviatilis]